MYFQVVQNGMHLHAGFRGQLISMIFRSKVSPHHCSGHASGVVNAREGKTDVTCAVMSDRTRGK